MPGGNNPMEPPEGAGVVPPGGNNPEDQGNRVNQGNQGDQNRGQDDPPLNVGRQLNEELGAEETKEQNSDDESFEEWEEHLPRGISEANRRASEQVHELQSTLRRFNPTTSRVTPKFVGSQSTPISGKAKRRKNLSSKQAGRGNSSRVIHGITVRGVARPTDEIQPTKTWNKLDRANLTLKKELCLLKAQLDTVSRSTISWRCMTLIPRTINP